MIKFLKVTAIKEGEVLGPAILAVKDITAISDITTCREVFIVGAGSMCFQVQESFEELVNALS